MFEKVLVAVDGSEHSNLAFEAACDLAKKYGSQILVLHIVPGSTGTGTIVSSDAHETFNEEGRRMIAGYEERLGQKNISNSKTILHQGDAAQKIIDVAHSEACSLIVLGSRGRSGFKELFMGSVGRKVSSDANCPVLIMR